MAFTLDQAVPWGRNRDEYIEMFQLSEEDLKKKIIGFGDGPASFNYESTKLGGDVTSLDLIYQFSADELRQRIDETKEIVLEQTRQNMHNFDWNKIQTIDQLEEVRMNAMMQFLADYPAGQTENRYIYHEFPARTFFNDLTFDLGLCSHFLLLYPALGLDFHLHTIKEMMRICKEVRISPAVDLDGNPPPFLDQMINSLKKWFILEIVQTTYAFLKTENQYLRITHRKYH